MVGFDPVEDTGFCMAEGPQRFPGSMGYICTLLDEHDGDHKAVDSRSGMVYDSWPRD